MLIQKSAYQDSDSDSDSDVSHFLSEASSVSSYQLKKKGKKGRQSHEECSGEKTIFFTPAIRIIFQGVQKLQDVWTSQKVKRTNCTPKLLKLSWLQELEERQQRSNETAYTKRCKITNNQTEYTLSEKEVILETKGKYHHLLKKATRRNRRLK